MYVWDSDFIITFPADGLAPNGARPSINIKILQIEDVLTVLKCIQIIMIPNFCLQCYHSQFIW